MWTERYVIVITSLHRDFLPQPGDYLPRDPLGLDDLRPVRFGLFFTLFFLFLRIFRPSRSARCVELVQKKTKAKSSQRAMANRHGYIFNSELYGIMAEFRKPEQLVCLRPARLTKPVIGRWTPIVPYEVEGLAEAIGFHQDARALCGLPSRASAGALIAYSMEWCLLQSSLSAQRRGPASA